jgi:type I restriction enzyme S subunit
MMWNLPRAWTWTPLGPHLLERAEAIGSLAPEEAARFDRLRGVSNREGIIDPPFDRVRPIKDSSRYVVLRVGYFSYNPMRINVGSIGLVRDDSQVGKISPDYVVFTTRRTLLPEYLFAYLKSDVGRQIIRASTAGAVRERLYFRDLARLPIPLPPLQEQRRIVRLLDAAEELRRLRDQADRRTADLIPAIFHEIFGDLESNPKGWAKIPLGELTEIGTGSTPSRAESSYFGGTIPWVKTTEVTGTVISATEEHLTEAGIKASRCKLYPKNSLVIALYGQGKTRGQTALLGIDACTNQACAVLKPNERYDSQFVLSVLQLSYSVIRRMSRGGTQENLNLNLIKKFEIPLPPLALQQAFATNVAEVRALEAQQTASRRRLDGLYQSLLHRAFRGEV